MRDEAISPSSSTRNSGLNRLHHGLDDVGADLLSHLAACDRRKAVVETGADTCIGDFIAENPKVGKVMRDPGQEGARQ